MSQQVIRSLILVAAMGSTLACGRSERVTTASTGATPGEARGTVVTTRDGTKFYGDDVAIDVYNYGTPGYRDNVVMAFLAGNGRELWTGQVEVARNILPTGSGTAVIKQAPLEIGIANVERKRGDYPVSQATSGTLTYSFGDPQRVDVAVETDAAVTSGMISARFQARCWVKASELEPTTDDTPGQPSDGDHMALDERFTTSQCAEFKAYGP